MATWRESAEDPRGSATAALVALQFRPTREVLDRACDLCRSADADERRLGVRVLGELRDLADPAAALPAFVDESMEVLLALAATEPDACVLVIRTHTAPSPTASTRPSLSLIRGC